MQWGIRLFHNNSPGTGNLWLLGKIHVDYLCLVDFEFDPVFPTEEIQVLQRYRNAFLSRVLYKMDRTSTNKIQKSCLESTQFIVEYLTDYGICWPVQLILPILRTYVERYGQDSDRRYTTRLRIRPGHVNLAGKNDLISKRQIWLGVRIHELESPRLQVVLVVLIFFVTFCTARFWDCWTAFNR